MADQAEEVADLAAEEVADQDDEDEEDPAPFPNDTNPLFAGARRYFWRQYLDPEKNARSLKKLVKWIIRRLEEQTAAENSGIVQRVTQEIDGQSYTYKLTAEAGFFKIVVIPAPDLSDEQLPLSLMFSFRDLYLVGFLHNNVWHVFDDARLTGTGHIDHPEAYQLLGFKGAYVNAHFSGVKLGNWDLHMSYDSLMHYPDRSKNEVRMALFRIIVLVCESCRFPEWLSNVELLLTNNLSETTDQGGNFSSMFKDWSTISKRARRGATRFVRKEGDMFSSFARILQNLSVALSRPPANEL